MRGINITNAVQLEAEVDKWLQMLIIQVGYFNPQVDALSQVIDHVISRDDEIYNRSLISCIPQEYFEAEDAMSAVTILDGRRFELQDQFTALSNLDDDKMSDTLNDFHFHFFDEKLNRLRLEIKFLSTVATTLLHW